MEGCVRLYEILHDFIYGTGASEDLDIHWGPGTKFPVNTKGWFYMINWFLIKIPGNSKEKSWPFENMVLGISIYAKLKNLESYLILHIQRLT